MRGSKERRLFWRKEGGLTYQKQAPPGGHEGEDADDDVLKGHAGDRDEDDEDRQESQEDQPLDQAEDELMVRAELHPPERYRLKSSKSTNTRWDYYSYYYYHYSERLFHDLGGPRWLKSTLLLKNVEARSDFDKWRKPTSTNHGKTKKIDG